MAQCCTVLSVPWVISMLQSFRNTCRKLTQRLQQHIHVWCAEVACHLLQTTAVTWNLMRRRQLCVHKAKCTKKIVTKQVRKMMVAIWSVVIAKKSSNILLLEDATCRRVMERCSVFDVKSVICCSVPAVVYLTTLSPTLLARSIVHFVTSILPGFIT